MFDFSTFIDLPLIWGLLIATAVLIYVLLDGFDLGIGILFPFAPSDTCRDRMMNSIAPFWDGNETWLVLSGGGLFAVFPLAYSILMPAFYILIITMLFGLILRGVAVEFRFKADKKSRWDYIFHFGSLTAAFCQGMILGGFLQGVEVEGRHFSGGPFDWATGFSVMMGITVVFGYTLLGSTWLVMKTEDITQEWARKTATYILGFIGIYIALMSLLFNERIIHVNFYYLFLLSITGLFIMLWIDLKHSKREYRPFFLSISIVVIGYLVLSINIYPWIIPFKYTIREAAASGPGLSLMLIGAILFLPLILTYTGYCYYVFRGKTNHEHLY
ncbi:MAG: cytochrome d ubiquinol oxidase subunit II [Proteobacteria bacterium]|nr:cytochrome d ubiquinol oxidase subunit II [Pseudomonadota bacterium]